MIRGVATVSAGRAAVPKGGALAHFPVLAATRPVGGDITRCRVTGTVRNLTARPTECIRSAAVSARGAAVAKARATADFAAVRRAAGPVGGQVTRAVAQAELGLAAGAAVARRVPAVAARGAAGSEAGAQAALVVASGAALPVGGHVAGAGALAKRRLAARAAVRRC